MQVINQAILERHMSRKEAATAINMLTKLAPFRYVQSSEPSIKRIGVSWYCKRKTFKIEDVIEKLEEYIASTTLYKTAYASKPHKRKLLKVIKGIKDD